MDGQIPALPGSYTLMLRCDETQTLQVGRAFQFDLRPGWYAYVGSAFGPGGLAARLRHHLRVSPRPRWHLDWLRPHLRVEDIWWALGPQRLECRWAGTLASLPGAQIPRAGFGASDCIQGCAAHLILFGTIPALSGWRKPLEEILEGLSGAGGDGHFGHCAGPADEILRA